MGAINRGPVTAHFVSIRPGATGLLSSKPIQENDGWEPGAGSSLLTSSRVDWLLLPAEEGSTILFVASRHLFPRQLPESFAAPVIFFFYRPSICGIVFFNSNGVANLEIPDSI